MTTISRAEMLQSLVAGYEARPITEPRDVIADRVRDSAVGRELNRLQGYQGTEMSERVQLLVARGQVTRTEARELILNLAREAGAGAGLGRSVHER